MPYYKDANILFIHIPKTGGNSVERYLIRKYRQTLLFGTGKKLIKHEKYRNFSLQHQYYSTIKDNSDSLGVDFNDKLRIFTVVRNPYERILSDMFWQDYINLDTTPEEVYAILPKYYETSKDNHSAEQYKFLVDNNGKLPTNLTIMKTESLNKDMINNGFINFDIHENKNKKKLVSYDQYLNDNVINSINQKYSKDFDLFGYIKK